MIKQRIKEILDIKDSIQDTKLTIIIDNVTKHLKALLGKDVPNELEFIIEEISIRRFNRIGTEGMKSESVEGHTTSYFDLKDEFVPYEEIIQANKADSGISKRGRVRFL